VEASAPGRGADGARPVIGSYEVPRLLLSTAEVADALGISERFAKNLVYSGELASLKVGRLRRVYVGDVYAWIERQRGGPLGIVEDRVAPVHRGTGWDLTDSGWQRGVDFVALASHPSDRLGMVVAGSTLKIAAAITFA
jgi:excisionase family DNA binding protein